MGLALNDVSEFNTVDFLGGYLIYHRVAGSGEKLINFFAHLKTATRVRCTVETWTVSPDTLGHFWKSLRAGAETTYCRSHHTDPNGLLLSVGSATGGSPRLLY